MAGPATIIGVFVYQSGWQRANGGTPTGFSGPQVRRSGSWTNCVDVQANVSNVWKETWVNVNGEVSAPTFNDFTAKDFDISPYVVDAYVEMNADGSVDRKNLGNVTNNYSEWRLFDCGRTKQYHVLEDTNYTGSIVVTEPTKGQWLDFSSTLTFECSKIGTGFLDIDSGWATYIRDKDRADPLGSVPRGDVDITLTAEF